jgi:dCMP deaminase
MTDIYKTTYVDVDCYVQALVPSRLSKDEYYMKIALAAAGRSTCLNRQVGAVLVDKLGCILATGYNGSPRGLINCCDVGECRRKSLKTGEGFIDSCLAVHAEQNALLQCRDVEQAVSLYVTTEPCSLCTRMLINTGVVNVIFKDAYKASGVVLWRSAGRGNWRQI